MSELLVIIPLYNKEQTVSRCLQSVLSQDYKDFKILIVNDGSTDDSIQIVEDLNDKRIILIAQENQGVSAARNAGLQYAQKHHFEYVAFLDADDYWKENHLSSVLKVFENHSSAEVVATNYEVKKSKKTTIQTKFSNLELNNSKVLKDFFTHNYLNSIFSSSSFAIKCSVLEKTGVYNTAFTHGEDTDFFIRLGIHTVTAFSSRVTAIIDKSRKDNSQAIDVNNRKYLDLDVYENINIPGLKKYLDLNRYSIALDYRMSDDIAKAWTYQQKIDLDNLSARQQQLLKMSPTKLKALAKTKKVLEFMGLDLRTG